MVSSAMEDKLGNGILCGRPFGGTAILVRKVWMSIVIKCRLIIRGLHVLVLLVLIALILFFSSVYMPWSDRSPEQVIEYEATLGVGHMQSIVDRHIACSFLFGGDFNVTKNSKSACC